MLELLSRSGTKRQSIVEPALSPWVVRGWLGAILVVALLTYLASALPHIGIVRNGDEENFVETALRMGSGTLEPFGLRHGTGFPILLFAEFGVMYFLGWIQGTMQAPIDLAWHYVRDPALFFLIGRLTVVVMGGVMVGLTYLIGRRLVSSITGLLAAAFIGLCLLPVTVAARVKEELVAAVLLLLAFLMSARLAGAMGAVRRPRWLAFWSGLLIGLASACKYTAVLGGAFVVLGLVWSWPVATEQEPISRRWGRVAITGLLAGLGAGLGFLLLTPAAVTNSGMLVEGIRMLAFGHTQFVQPVPPTILRLSQNFPDAVGMPLAILMGIGSVWGVLRRDRAIWLLLIYPLALVIFMAPYIPVAAHLLPALPFLCLIAADGLTRLVRLFRMPPRMACLCLVIAGGAVLWPTFLDSWRLIAVLRRPDTRMLARPWIEQHVPAGSHLLVEGARYGAMWLGLELPGDAQTWQDDVAEITVNGGRGRLVHMRWASAKTHPSAVTFQVSKVFMATAEIVESMKPAYIVTTGYLDRDLFQGDPTSIIEVHPCHRTEVRQARVALRALLDRKYTVIATFDPRVRFHEAFPEMSIGDFARLRRVPLLGDRTSYFQGPLITVYQRREAVSRS